VERKKRNGKSGHFPVHISNESEIVDGTPYEADTKKRYAPGYESRKIGFSNPQDFFIIIFDGLECSWKSKICVHYLILSPVIKWAGRKILELYKL
jgi:hypothetical protein